MLCSDITFLYEQIDWYDLEGAGMVTHFIAY